MAPAVLFHRPLRTGLFVLCALVLAGCNHKPITANVPPPSIAQLSALPSTAQASAQMKQLAGTYQAVLPCNNCPGIAIIVQLRADQTASVRERRFGGDGPAAAITTYTGPFKFDPPGGSMISLRPDSQAPIAYRFMVGDDWIEMRDRNSSAPLSGQATYRLKKTSTPQQ